MSEKYDAERAIIRFAQYPPAMRIPDLEKWTDLLSEAIREYRCGNYPKVISTLK